MKFVIGALALTALLGAAILWMSKTSHTWESTTVLIGIGLGLIVVVWMLGAWLRERKRRRLTDMRDSALW
jgi:hypothetical protein